MAIWEIQNKFIHYIPEMPCVDKLGYPVSTQELHCNFQFDCVVLDGNIKK